MHEIFTSSDKLTTLVDQVEQAITEHNGDEGTFIAVLFYLAILLTILSSLVFVWMLSRDSGNRSNKVNTVLKPHNRLSCACLTKWKCRLKGI